MRDQKEFVGEHGLGHAKVVRTLERMDKGRLIRIIYRSDMDGVKSRDRNRRKWTINSRK